MKQQGIICLLVGIQLTSPTPLSVMTLCLGVQLTGKWLPFLGAIPEGSWNFSCRMQGIKFGSFAKR